MSDFRSLNNFSSFWLFVLVWPGYPVFIKRLRTRWWTRWSILQLKSQMFTVGGAPLRARKVTIVCLHLQPHQSILTAIMWRWNPKPFSTGHRLVALLCTLWRLGVSLTGSGVVTPVKRCLFSSAGSVDKRRETLGHRWPAGKEREGNEGGCCPWPSHADSIRTPEAPEPLTHMRILSVV